MLLFIERPKKKLDYRFQSFNTSHVVIYRLFFPQRIQYHRVSIHPMLLFICNQINNHLLQHMFQYIPCCYLSIQRCKRGFRASYVSIHSMLLFIKCGSWERTSRFDVSIHPMLLFIPLKKEERELTQEFQYIPCCYLSIWDYVQENFGRSFQYIPCCYLSYESKWS